MSDGPMEYHTDSWYNLDPQKIDAMIEDDKNEHAHLVAKAREADPELVEMDDEELSGTIIKSALDKYRGDHSQKYAQAAGLKDSASLFKYFNGKLAAADFEFCRKLHHELPVKGETYRERGAVTDQATSQMMMIFQSIDAGTREFVTLSRQIRTLDVMRGLLERERLTCSQCLSNTDDPSRLYLFITCGHILCGKCESEFDRQEEVQCPINGCDCAIKSAIFACSSLFQGGTGIPLKLEAASPKVQRILDTIEKEVPRDEKVLLFVSNPMLKAQLHDEMIKRNMPFFETRGESTDTNAIRTFKGHTGRAVLLQTLMSSESAGTNLTEANHVMFAAPLHTDSQNYHMYERQARARAIRYGQGKRVVVYHFVTAYTIEVDILQHRFRQVLKIDQGLDSIEVDTKSRDAWSKQFLFGNTFAIREHNRGRDPVMVAPFDIGQTVPSAAAADAAGLQNGMSEPPAGESTLTKLQKWLEEVAAVSTKGADPSPSPSPSPGPKEKARDYQADIGAFLAPEQVRKLLCSGDVDEWLDELVVERTT